MQGNLHRSRKGSLTGSFVFSAAIIFYMPATSSFGNPVITIILVTIVIAIIVFALRRKKELKRIDDEAFANAAYAFIEELRKNKGFTPISSSLILDKNEHVLLVEETTLYEPQSVKYSRGGGGGFRIAKGITIGRYAGTSETRKEWRALDEGSITLTNKRLIFDGTKENRTIKLDKIISVNPSRTSIELSIDGRAKGIIFSVDNSYIWMSAIHICRKVEDPLNLEGINLTFTFK